MPITRLRFISLLTFCVCLMPPLSAFAGDDWRPVTPAELSSKTAGVEKDADAEGVFWEVRIDDSQPDEISLKNYIRVKIFTDRGKEKHSNIDIRYSGSSRIKDIAARVIKADGTILELKKEDIFERTIAKANGFKEKAKSFALPGIEAGSIIEYRWRDVHPGGSADRLRLHFQRDIPIQNVSYFLKPFMGMQYLPFRMGETRFVKDKDGFSRVTMTNMPAFREEPRMPPEDEVRSWVFLYYTADNKTEVAKYWKDVGKLLYGNTKDEMKDNDEVKAAVAGIIGDASTPEEKLRRIYDFCRTKIRNLSDDATLLTEEEKKKLKPNKSAAETLRKGMGTGGNIDMLFAALAKAAGFDARLALSGNRGEMFFDRGLANISFLQSAFIAVKVGEGWQYFSPAEVYTSFGMLGWPEESQETLITDPKEPFWTRTSTSAPEKSSAMRRATLQLMEDGTLEGNVSIEYTGHQAFDKKEYDDDDSPSQREETLRASVKSRMSTAEVTDIKIENVTDPIKPIIYSYRVRIPGYAQRTGKRIFLQPGYFEHGRAPLFSGSERKHSVYFNYPWLEEDEVTINLPAGYALDNADAPAPFKSGEIAAYQPSIHVTADGKTLVYKRRFFFGGGGNILFPVESYAGVKALFDQLNKQDNHTITLKQGTTAAAK
ncbi:MAG TPA: DUF3857 and transglutaminase domain-containing protein [Pyrinomonadaceae bacterium]|nr:DUF3857 and transglutaminase domain-containing protein [Pyrinomonadaceae bacterium]